MVACPHACVYTLLVKLNHVSLDCSKVPSSALVEGLAPPPPLGHTDLILQTTDPECKLKSLMPKLLALSLNRWSFTPSTSNAPLQAFVN